MHVNSDLVVRAAIPATSRERLLRIADVEAATGCKKSTIYKLMREGRFPARVRITARYAVWPESAVMAWVHARIAGVQECKQ